MASLDKFLMALGTAPPTTLVLYEGCVAELRFDGGTRPITKQALSAEQIVGLLREIAPAAMQASVMQGGPARFAYDGNGIPVDVAIQRDADGRVVAQIAPASPPTRRSAKRRRWPPPRRRWIPVRAPPSTPCCARSRPRRRPICTSGWVSRRSCAGTESSSALPVRRRWVPTSSSRCCWRRCRR